ncbi:MAG: DnaB-like helicase C-terminal domain-containing protein [Rubripirellula sp.]|nr:DnaB-like helicase C-terminal domain-containing protein [Rubripirellula sp.]
MTFKKSSAALVELTERITNREKEVSYSCGIAGDDFVLAPGKMTFIGAPPGTGKTALASQICFEALEQHSDLKLYIANAEMDIDELLIREISRRSSVGHKLIRTASFDEDQYQRIMDAAAALIPSIARVRHMVPPFDGESLGQLSLLDEPGILVVDYVQKFRASDRDTRSGVDEVVNVLRSLALDEWAVLAMSATARQQGGKKGGHDHAGLSLSSFKESGEIEFNADAAYVLRDVTEGDKAVREINLDCVKNRRGQLHNTELLFCGDFMRFEARAPERHSDFDDWNKPFVSDGGFAL